MRGLKWKFFFIVIQDVIGCRPRRLYTSIQTQEDTVNIHYDKN